MLALLRVRGFRLLFSGQIISTIGDMFYAVALPWLLLGSIDTFALIPSVQAHNQQQRALVQDLLRLGATRIYADYWTCDLVIFLSQEQIICSVLNKQLQPGFDRYLPYRAIVHSDPQSSYVFPVKSPQAVAIAAKIAGIHYRLTVVDNYDVYQLVQAVHRFSERVGAT